MRLTERGNGVIQRRSGAQGLMHSLGLIFIRFKVQFFLVVCGLLLAAIPATAEHNRHIQPAQWQALTQDKAFSYKNDIEAIEPVKQYEPGALQKVVAALFKFFGGRSGNILLWIIVVCIVLYILYKLFLSSDSFLFSRSKKILNDTANAPEEEDLATTNWEALFHQAVHDNEMRQAVRYSYKWLLQLLEQKELIQYRNDKTNYEYYTELHETDYKQPFKQLSRQYEYAWYGHFALAPNDYNDYLALFNTVRKQLGE